MTRSEAQVVVPHFYHVTYSITSSSSANLFTLKVVVWCLAPPPFSGNMPLCRTPWFRVSTSASYSVQSLLSCLFTGSIRNDIDLKYTVTIHSNYLFTSSHSTLYKLCNSESVEEANNTFIFATKATVKWLVFLLCIRFSPVRILAGKPHKFV